MKTILSLVLTFLAAQALAQITTIAPGAIAPGFTLTSTDDKAVSFTDYPAAKGFILVFTCNTCPYSKAYEKRIIGLNNKYASLGFPVIAINPNDPGGSPGDSFDQMKQHAKTARFNFPYLYDKDQVVTKSYGARNTPHVFLITKTAAGNTIAYTGAIDNDTPDTNPDKTLFVEDALAALLKNQTPARTMTKAIGCTVKWKRS